MFPQLETSISRRQEVTLANGEWFTCHMQTQRQQEQTEHRAGHTKAQQSAALSYGGQEHESHLLLNKIVTEHQFSFQCQAARGDEMGAGGGGVGSDGSKCARTSHQQPKLPQRSSPS